MIEEYKRETILEIKQTKTDRGICFTVNGSLLGTAHATVELFDKISLALDRNPEEIILDIAQASYVDSFSIGLLIGVLLKCREKKITMRMENVPKNVRFVLETVRLRDIFPELYK